jgi:copper chaperone CopZ
MFHKALIIVLATTLAAGFAWPAVLPANVYEVGISGMSCKGCVKEAKDLLAKIENVELVEVDLKAEKATITMKGTATLDRATTEKALKGSKFAVTSFAEKKGAESKPKN